VVVVLGKFYFVTIIIAIIMYIATRYCTKYQNVDSHKKCKYFHWGKDSIKIEKCIILNTGGGWAWCVEGKIKCGAKALALCVSLHLF